MLELGASTLGLLEESLEIICSFGIICKENREIKFKIERFSASMVVQKSSTIVVTREAGACMPIIQLGEAK